MDYNNKVKGYFENVRHEMIDLMPPNTSTILDVGCGKGNFGAFIKSKFQIKVWGIELMEVPGQIARKKLDKVLIGPCENHIENLPEGYFDVVYFNDVLEHLADPYSILLTIKNKLSKNGVVISSIPNVRYHRVLKDLLWEKNWEYTMDGVLDKTHLRFFTKKSILKMYDELGYEVLSHKGIHKTKSIKPYLYNLFVLFTSMDIFYIQYATVVRIDNNFSSGKIKKASSY